MTITHVQRQHGDHKIDGYEITCTGKSCTQTSFFPDTKHLPIQVVTKKFHDRRWEVDEGGHDLCPACIEKRRCDRRRKGGPKAAATAVRIRPEIEKLNISAPNIQRVISGAGFTGSSVIELEGKLPRFKITLPHLTEYSLGRINHAEREIVEHFAADIETSYFKPELTHTNGGLSVNVGLTMHWILALEPVEKEPVHRPDASQHLIQ